MPCPMPQEQKDHEVEASLDSIVRSCLRKREGKKKEEEEKVEEEEENEEEKEKMSLGFFPCSIPLSLKRIAKLDSSV